MAQPSVFTGSGSARTTPIALGYIRGATDDLVWFVALPVAATLVALGFQAWLPFVAHVSVAVWITIPHHYATWVRAYGLREDWERWRERLVVGPLVVVPLVVIASAFAPVTLVIVLMLWDHQHSMMQQYGFSRIYDFKAGSGSPATPRLDFWLGVVLYGNLLVVGPLWSELWLAELFRWGVGPSAAAVHLVQAASWGVAAAFGAFYVAHLAIGVARGQRVNPMKYAMLLASYGLWYFVSWQDSLLVYLVAHRIMHGVQYLLMVHWYLDCKAERSGSVPRLLGRLPLGRFLLLGGLYALGFQFVSGSGLADLGFGVFGAGAADGARANEFYAYALVSAAGAYHYYVDSFIWKVSDARTQEGL